MSDSMSIVKWAKREGVPERTAYYWRDTGKLPTVKRKKFVEEVPVGITKEDLVKG